MGGEERGKGGTGREGAVLAPKLKLAPQDYFPGAGAAQGFPWDDLSGQSKGERGGTAFPTSYFQPL